MGFMNKLNKMKSFLFDEEDDSKEVKKSSKKNANNEETKEIKTETKHEQEEKESVEELSFEEEEIKKDEIAIHSRSEKKETQFSFPEFDDDDFVVASKKPEPLVSHSVSNDAPRILYQGSKRKEEVKKFKPSPIISPVYGLLDNQGNSIKEESTQEKKSNYNDTLDEIRKKAYGTSIDELEDTTKLDKKTVGEMEKEFEEEKVLSRQKKKDTKVKEVEVSKVEKQEEDDDDDMILPNVNFKEIDVDKQASIKELDKTKSNDDDDEEDTKEQDLFNLIDTMYQNKEGED